MPATSVVVLDRKHSELITLEPSQVVHMPQGGPNGEPGSARHPILCERFHPIHANSCMKGSSCNRVHAAIRGATRKAIHINWAWRDLEKCEYDRFPAGETIKVREPVSAQSNIVDTVDSGYIIKNRCVFNDTKRPPTHCAHFYYGRECHLAYNCDFAHVVYINAQAEKQERAPPPCAFGRHRKTENNNVSTTAPNNVATPVSVRIGFPFTKAVPPTICSSSYGHGAFLPLAQQQQAPCSPIPASSPVTPQSHYLDLPNALERRHRLPRNNSNGNGSCLPNYSSHRRWRYDPYNTTTARSLMSDDECCVYF